MKLFIIIFKIQKKTFKLGKIIDRIKTNNAEAMQYLLISSCEEKPSELVK